MAEQAPRNEPRTHAGKSLAAADPSIARQIVIIEQEAASQPPVAPDLPRTDREDEVFAAGYKEGFVAASQAPAAPSLTNVPSTEFVNGIRQTQPPAAPNWTRADLDRITDPDRPFAEALAEVNRPAVTEGLDVDRLRQAVRTVADEERFDLGYTQEINRLADAVLREYARLSAEQPDPKPDWAITDPAERKAAWDGRLSAEQPTDGDA